MPWRRALPWLERGALIIGLLCLGLWARAELRSWAFQSAESRNLENSTAEKRDRAPAAATDPTKAGEAIGRIEIPRLGIRAIVAEGADAPTLELAVGHIPSTPPPGGEGNCGLAGHRDTFFRKLEGVRAGDLIRFSTSGRMYAYQVQWSRVVEPDRVDTLDPTRVPSLTLVTCYPFSFVGRAPKRFVVRARQVDAPGASMMATADRARGRTAAPASILMAAGR